VLRQLATLDNATNQLLLNAPSKLATELANPAGWTDVTRRNEARMERERERAAVEAEAENNAESRAARKIAELVGGGQAPLRASSSYAGGGGQRSFEEDPVAAAGDAEAEVSAKSNRGRLRRRGADSKGLKPGSSERSKSSAVAAKPRPTEGRSALQIDIIRDSIVRALKQPASDSRPFNDRTVAVEARAEEPAAHRGHESTSAALDDSEPVLTRHALLQRGRLAMETAERDRAAARRRAGEEEP
jgi:hypothetical protein